MPRIGLIAWLQESNTFLPNPTTLAEYEQDLLVTGPAVIEHFQSARHEMGGAITRLQQEPEVTLVPIFAARAIPYGTMTATTHAEIKARLLAALSEAGPLDGIYVAPHGATVSADVPDVDGDWLTAVREFVGPDIPIIGTLDPHVNLSPAIVAATDALFSYRTNPHIDQWETGQRAAELLLKTVAGKAHPVQAACWPPMAINIERQATSEPPLLGLCAERDRLEQTPGLFGVSLLLGFPYADVAEMGSAVLVVTDHDRTLAQRMAESFARSLWDARVPLAGTFLTPAEAVAQAATAAGPVCLLDMGDNVGGGSPADGTILAHELTRQGVGPAVVILYDPAAVQAAESLGLNGRGVITAGGKTDALHGPPLTSECVVQFLGDGRFEETQTRHGGFTEFDQGRIAIVRTDGGLTLLLTSRRVPPFSLKQLTNFGLDPAAFHVLVAKGVNAPLAAYAPVCRTILRVNTPGVTTADMTQLNFQHRRRPLFPFERDFDWSPAS